MPSAAGVMELERFERRLAAHAPRDATLFAHSRAAVAAVLRFDRGGPEVLLIRRAQSAGDRWSGQVAMPGGREDEGDADLLATAIRETREEVGIDLTAGARLLGRLGAVRAVARGRLLPMTITPFVFHQTREAPLLLSAEATESFWLPLDRAARGELDDRFTYRLGPLPLRLPCWTYQGHTVWGLTHQMLRSLLAVVQSGM